MRVLDSKWLVIFPRPLIRRSIPSIFNVSFRDLNRLSDHAKPADHGGLAKFGLEISPRLQRLSFTMRHFPCILGVIKHEFRCSQRIDIRELRSKRPTNPRDRALTSIWDRANYIVHAWVAWIRAGFICYTSTLALGWFQRSKRQNQISRRLWCFNSSRLFERYFSFISR